MHVKILKIEENYLRYNLILPEFKYNFNFENNDKHKNIIIFDLT